MRTTWNHNRNSAIPSGILTVYPMKNKGMYFFDGSFAYLYILFGNIFNIADSFRMINSFQMFTHGLSGNGNTFVHYKGCFLQSERISFYTITFVGVFNIQSVLNLFQGFFGQWT